MMVFKEYIDRNNSVSKKRLGLLINVLKKDGLRVEDFTHDDIEPYIFVYSYPLPTTFEGVRFYMHGDILAFRTQKKAETQPYGEAYALDLQQMLMNIFQDEKDKSEKNITKVLLKLIGKEIRDYFKKSVAAEKDLLSGQVADGKNSAGQIIIRNNGTDYANTVTSKWN